jgi:hypothetical protein
VFGGNGSESEETIKYDSINPNNGPQFSKTFDGGGGNHWNYSAGLGKKSEKESMG